MHVPSNVSEEACDRLVDLLFSALPAVDPDELAVLLHHLLKITSLEVQRAVHDERSRVRESLRQQIGHPQ